MNEINRLLAANMKKARNLLGYSQLKLAELCDLSPSYVGDIEIGKKFPSAETLWKLSTTLHLEPHQLLAGKANQSREWDKMRVLSVARAELRERVLKDIDSVINKLLQK